MVKKMGDIEHRRRTSSRNTNSSGGGLSKKKMKLNKGAWTAEEDEKLIQYVKIHGHNRWRRLPAEAGLNRCGKSCRLRWLNYLRPGIKRGNISEDEEDLIIRLHNLLGNRWSLIAGRLPGRTDNEIKNHWNTNLSKKPLTISQLNLKLSQKLETNINDAQSSSTFQNEITCSYNNDMIITSPGLSHSCHVETLMRFDDSNANRELFDDKDFDANGFIDWPSLMGSSDPLVGDNLASNEDIYQNLLASDQVQEPGICDMFSWNMLLDFNDDSNNFFDLDEDNTF